MRRRCRLASVACSVACAALPGVAHAYCRTTTCDFPENARDPECLRDAEGCSLSGMPLRWTRRCVSFSVEAQGSPLRGIAYDEAAATIGRSLSEWTEVDCGLGRPNIEVVPFAPYECAAVGYSLTGPNSNAWVFLDDDWPDDGDHTALTLAVTTVTANLDTGEIYDVDVEVNSQMYSLTEEDGSLLSAVALHEAGHFFGLSDLYARADASATMYGHYQGSLQCAEAPGWDDTAGICAIYPPSQAEAAVCDATPRRGFSPACPAERNTAGACQFTERSTSRSGWTGLHALTLLGLGLGVRRRRLMG